MLLFDETRQPKEGRRNETLSVLSQNLSYYNSSSTTLKLEHPLERSSPPIAPGNPTSFLPKAEVTAMNKKDAEPP
jgi:hypothetical protein